VLPDSTFNEVGPSALNAGPEESGETPLPLIASWDDFPLKTARSLIIFLFWDKKKFVKFVDETENADSQMAEKHNP
jgi:hypothetical protein